MSPGLNRGCEADHRFPSQSDSSTAAAVETSTLLSKMSGYFHPFSVQGSSGGLGMLRVSESILADFEPNHSKDRHDLRRN